MLESPFLKDLLPEQAEAVSYKDGPLLIVAGAGTGKTTVITRRLAWLICEAKIKPDEILALTFTDKAAGEMEERVDKLLPYGYVDLWISTFHSFGERLLRSHGLDIGLPSNFKLINETEAWLLVRQNLDKFNLDYYRPLGNPAKFIHALIKHFSRCKDEEIEPADYLKYAEELKLNADNAHTPETDDEIKRLNEISNAYHVYNQLLLDNEKLDFGDLIHYTLKLFKTRPKILKAYREKFKYILIDEFQDTNLAQYELIKLLSAPRNNLTVVGDDDQSVYKFRGASISNILHFKTDYSDAKLITLVKNFRSMQNILDISYKSIINNNPYRLEEKLQIDKRLVSPKPGLGEIKKIIMPIAEDEAKSVVEKISELKEKGSTWSDFAILIRSNSHADAFGQALERQGIPYQFFASSGLYRQTIVMDILAYLRLLDNYHENSAMYRALNMPLWGIGTFDLVKLNHQAKKKSWSLYETAKQAQIVGINTDTLASIDRLLGLIAKHTTLAREKTVGQVILAFLEESGYLKDLAHRANLGEAEALRQLTFLSRFYKIISRFEQSHEEKLVRHFLAEFNYVLESGDDGALGVDWDEGPDTVKIMTVHGAKGLEFKYVFLVNLVEQRFPATDRSEAIELPDALIKEVLPEGDAHIQEERRLFYVGMTRAKEGLFFSYALNYGGTRDRKPSRFLFEIGLEEKGSEKSKKTAHTAEQIADTLSVPETKPAEYFPPAPAHFSYSQLAAFDKCPYQYKFAHILHVPTRGTASFSFGKTIHSTLQKFFERVIELNTVQQAGLFDGFANEQNFSPEDCLTSPDETSGRGDPQKKNFVHGKTKVPALDELIKIYEESWQDDWYESKKQKETYYARGLKNLKEFYSLHEAGGWSVPTHLEVGFHLKMAGEQIKGAIDRIDPLSDGTVELIDYKTGNPKDAEKMTFDDKEQLFIYQLAVAETLGLRPARLSFYYLENNQKISFLGTDKDLDKLRKKVEENILAIKSSQFPSKASLFICKYCDFKEICEYATY